ERMMIVGGAFGMDLHAVAKLAGVLVKRGFEPALAHATTFEPVWREGSHFLDDCPRVDIRCAEQLKWSGCAATFRERRSFEHHRSSVGARHPQIRRIGTWVHPSVFA